MAFFRKIKILVQFSAKQEPQKQVMVQQTLF